MEFRIRWSQYRLNSDTKEQGAKKLADMLKHDPAFFFTLEEAGLYDGRRSLLKMLFRG